jgi:hypothetical protein
MSIENLDNILHSFSDRLEGIIDTFFNPVLDMSELDYKRVQEKVQMLYSDYQTLDVQLSTEQKIDCNKTPKENIIQLGESICEVFSFLRQDYPPIFKGIHGIRERVYGATGDLIHNRCYFKTATGIRVRNRYEKWVADILTKYGIEYEYEHELKLDEITTHPDFYLPTYNVYIEFLGLLNFDKGYRITTMKKIQLYSEHNVPMIFIRSPNRKKTDARQKALERTLIDKISKKTGKLFSPKVE